MARINAASESMGGMFMMVGLAPRQTHLGLTTERRPAPIAAVLDEIPLTLRPEAVPQVKAAIGSAYG